MQQRSAAILLQPMLLLLCDMCCKHSATGALHPSITLTAFPFEGHRDAWANLGCHWVRSRVHAGQVASPSQAWHTVTNKRSHSHSHLHQSTWTHAFRLWDDARGEHGNSTTYTFISLMNYFIQSLTADSYLPLSIQGVPAVRATPSAWLPSTACWFTWEMTQTWSWRYKYCLLKHIFLSHSFLSSPLQ